MKPIHHPLRLIALSLALIVSAAALTVALAAAAQAYSYAAAAKEPLLDGREAMFTAAQSGDWAGVRTACEAMKSDLQYLDQNEDVGVSHAFEAAIAARDAQALQAAFTRAAGDEIVRRLNGARNNLKSYQAAKVLVVTANRFYTAIAADLDPGASKVIAAHMPAAIDAVGNPGVFGVGSRPADPEAFDAARAAIFQALGKPAPETPSDTAR